MSQENVEIVKEFAQRFAAGGSVSRQYFDSEIVWDTSASGMPSAGVYHGLQGVRRFWRDWLEPWEDYEIDYSEYIDAGDAVVLVFRQAGTGRGSGIRIEREFFGVWYLKDSKVVRFRLFESRGQALEAAGLSERAMSQENVEPFAKAVRAGQRAFNEGDFEAAFDGLAPDVEWHSGAWVLDAGLLKGRDAVISHFVKVRDAGDWQVDAVEFTHVGEACFIVHQRGRLEGRTTKIQGAMDFFQVWEIGADGLVARVREYESREDAFNAAGLSE